MSRRLLVVPFIVLLTASIATADPSAPTTEAKEQWASKCAGCHGHDGAGKPHKTPDMASVKFQKKSDEELTRAIRDGISGTKMRSFKSKLSTEQIGALVAYVRSFAKK